MQSMRAVGVAGLLALGCAGAPAAPPQRESDEGQQALAVRGIADFYGVGQQRGLLWCVSLCEAGRCASPSPQFVARFSHEQYRVNDPGHCTWRDGRVTYSGRASAQLGAQQLDLRTPPRGALYLDVGPASGCTGQECTVTAKLTVGPGTTRVLLVNLERRTGDWRVQGIEEQRPAR
jgi:hypothetical protein